MLLLYLFINVILVKFSYAFNEVVTLNERSCSENEYYDPVSFSCIICDPWKFLVPSNDRISCECNSRSIEIGWSREGFPKCQECPEGELPSADLTACVPCRKAANGSRDCSLCQPGYISVDRALNGTVLAEAICVRCRNGTAPDSKSRSCLRCGLAPGGCPCGKDQELIKGVGCLAKSIVTSWPRGSDMYDLHFDDQHITSKYFYDHLLTVLYKCKMNDFWSCQYLGNLCVLNLYQDLSPGGPCSPFKDSRRFNDIGLPKIYVGEPGDAPGLLYKRTVAKRFTLDESEDSFISFYVNKWRLNGTWIGRHRSFSFLELCPLEDHTDRVRFASEYVKTCIIPARKVVQRPEPIFYDVYLVYHENNQTFLYPIPLLISNFRHHKKFVNRGGDLSQWQLTKRFFDVDTVAGFRLVHNNSVPFVFRYLKSATLSVNVLQGKDEGVIHPPLLTINYALLTKTDIDKNIDVKITFKVHFSKPDNSKKTFDIALGTLCSLSALWSFLRTWSNTKRSDQRAIDLVTVLHLCIIASGHLSNVFFFVSACAALHSFVYYKWQIIAHVLLPSSRLTYYVRTYIIVSFPLKIVEVLYMVWNHLNIDIFLIDWEQPRMQKQNFSVSAWRTYFVSNKWNEIQTERRTSILLQICMSIMFLKFWGLENWALSVPDLQTNVSSSMQHYNFNLVHRVAVGVMVYCSVYFVQSLFISGLYERYIKNPIQEFVDFCSLANISVFILALENYGYYIHGRSVHGFSDTDMATLKRQLRREEEDLVGHRGLLPASDHQTFRMLIPPKLRFFYHSLIPSHKNVNSNFHLLPLGKDGKTQAPPSTADYTMQSYVTINRFLAAFIEHALKDLDYEVKEKTFVEAFLDIELWNVENNGTFYNDNGHSFDNVLYYGNESTLFTFNLIMFSFVEMMCQDFLFAAIITVLSDEIIARLRRYGGRKNFSRKTLIDEQFLL